MDSKIQKVLKKSAIFVTIVLIALHPQKSSQQATTNKSSIIPASCMYWYDSENIYTCSLYISGPVTSTDVLEITGKHYDNHTDPDVQAVFQNPHYDLFFNGEVLKKFENLKSIHVIGEELMEINQNAFDVCPKLETLRLRFNKLTTFPSEMLKNCANLINFDVVNYGLTSIPEDLFGTTYNLEKLTLQGNLTLLPSKLLENMDKLEEFYGDYNKFHDLKDIADALNGRTNLKILWLTYNNFSSFDFRFFSQFQKLEQLRIGYFNGHEWTQFSWYSLPSTLTLLTVYGIGENIPENAFSQLPGLNELTISGYGIEYLHRNIFKPLTNLSKLVIELTSIKSFPSDLFANLTNLNKLTITYSQVHRLNANSFGNNLQLQNMDFYHNRINEIQRGIFKKINTNVIFVSLRSNVCADEYFQGDNLDEEECLNKCFTNWETIPDNGCGKCIFKFQILLIVCFAYFMK